MSDDPRPRVSPHLPWGLALVLASFANCVLWKTALGLNWALCIAFAAAALVLVARRRFGAARAPATVAAGWATIVALGAAVTTEGQLLALILLTSLGLFTVALAMAGRGSLASFRARMAVTAPLAALVSVITGLCAEIAGAGRATRERRISSAFRSAAITLPVIIVLVLLLGDADPLFAAMRTEVETFLPFDDPARFLFFALLLAAALGTYSTLSRGEVPASDATAGTGLSIGALENRVLMAGVAMVMWTFAISATVSLLRDPAAKAGSGVTYAEYARSGFAQLSIAATLVIGTVLATRREWLPSDRWTRRIAALALGGVGAMLVIAFVRVLRYEQAYGFTVARLEAQGYMLVLACILALLGLEIVRRALSPLFTYHCATAALTIFAAFVYWNTDAWIVRRNIDRYRSIGKIDLRYLERLSDDATPALLGSLRDLRDPERASLLQWLADARSGRSARDDSWFAWNLRAARSASALRSFEANMIPSASPPRRKTRGAPPAHMESTSD